MLGFFKKRKKEKADILILDLNGNQISVGSVVKCLRYDLGECVVEKEGRAYFYVSKTTGQRVSFTKMFDAVTKNQKVELID